ncbi:MAG: hypothetical protein LBE12_06300 [Planctomycetaceae bacterium]|jgi:hypothetical protein|nr:hypothetical protein [Planctomycetaceae bacterium]
MSFAPSNPNWQWFGTLSKPDIETFASQNPNIFWLQKANQWLEDRSAEGPPENYVPVLTVGGQEDGQLGFIVVNEKRTYGKSSDLSDFEQHAYNAAKIIFDLFKPFDHSLGEPFVEIHLDSTGSGSSLSLPVIIAALQWLTGIVLPDTVVSTGCLKERKLTPVGFKTLFNKIKVAKRFGYKTLLVVKGQEGMNDVTDGFKIIEINSNPLLALFDILELASNKDEAGESIVRLLAAYSNRNIRNKLEDVEAIVSSFVYSTDKLVKHVANDLLSRSALHNGETEKSAKYREAAGTLNWNEIPTNNLGHYLRYEQAASCSILAVDNGEWNNEHYSHQEVEKRIIHLQQAIDGTFADADDYLSMLTMLNTRALRKRFLARLNYIYDKNKAIELLQSAWNDLMFLMNDWDEIWKYVRKIDRHDTTFERQRNYCLECLADYKRITNGTLLMELVHADQFFNLLSKQEFFGNNGFDNAAWIQYQYVQNREQQNQDHKLSENELTQFIEQIDETYKTWQGYPNFLAYELLLRYEFVNDLQKEHCLLQLQKVNLTVEPTSIETLLALRTRQFLLDNGYNVTDPVVPPADTPLRKIYDDLISHPNVLINRCPY